MNELSVKNNDLPMKSIWDKENTIKNDLSVKNNGLPMKSIWDSRIFNPVNEKQHIFFRSST